MQECEERVNALGLGHGEKGRMLSAIFVHDRPKRAIHQRRVRAITRCSAAHLLCSNNVKKYSSAF